MAPGYVWGAPVRRVFSHVGIGVALAAALHAPGADEAMEVVCRGNAVPDEQAGHIAIVAYIRSLGTDWRRPIGRRIATMHEVVGVHDGRAETRLLHHWDERTDRFETLAQPRRIALGRPSH